jgi:NAD-dependent SIR2 family protein deacetylase
MATKRKYQMGPGGRCVCVKCGHSVAHVRGKRCIERRCEKCGAVMLREDSEHHQATQKNKE